MGRDGQSFRRGQGNGSLESESLQRGAQLNGSWQGGRITIPFVYSTFTTIGTGINLRRSREVVVA